MYRGSIAAGAMLRSTVLPPDGCEDRDRTLRAKLRNALLGVVGHQIQIISGMPFAHEVSILEKDGAASGKKLPNHGPLTRPFTRRTGLSSR